MKGIILAGGSGNRLYPLTQVLSKQLQPVYDKPMIYYPLSLLMLCGIKDVLIISTERDTPFIQKLLGNGSRLGINLSFAVQKEPKGISEAFIIGKDFIQNDNVVLILGDNIFHGKLDSFRNAINAQEEKLDGIKGRVFAYKVSDPERYGVVEFDKNSKKVLSIEEKPLKPKSNFAIPGFYIFDETASERALEIRPSPRGELEITSLIESYAQEKTLGVEVISRGVAWLDTGTPQSLLEASSYIAAIEHRQGTKVACLEEIALRKNFISEREFLKIIEEMPNSYYQDYLKKVLEENHH